MLPPCHFLLYSSNTIVTLRKKLSLIPLVGTPETDPLAVKLLDNRLYMNVPTYLVAQNVHGPCFTTPQFFADQK